MVRQQDTRAVSFPDRVLRIFLSVLKASEPLGPE